MTNLTEIINNQEINSRTKHFEEVTSKKKLSETGYFTIEQINELNKLKNTFSFSVHVDHRYLIATVYLPKDGKYKFYVVDTKNMQGEEADSIKLAKKRVLELVGAEAVPAVAETTTEETVTPPEAVDEPKTPGYPVEVTEESTAQPEQSSESDNKEADEDLTKDIPTPGRRSRSAVGK